MERDGYTYRVVNDSDQRSFKVFLTEKGNVTEDHNREIAKAFDQKALANLSDEEISTLLSLLSKVKDNIIGGDSPKGN
jgi:DNA-binding MarR family transcriptional regulator